KKALEHRPVQTITELTASTLEFRNALAFVRSDQVEDHTKLSFFGGCNIGLKLLDPITEVSGKAPAHRGEFGGSSFKPAAEEVRSRIVVEGEPVADLSDDCKLTKTGKFCHSLFNGKLRVEDRQ